MIGMRLMSLTLAAACLTAAAPTVGAGQASPPAAMVTTGPQFTRGDRASPGAAQQNVQENQQYEALLQTNPAFRVRRIAQECGPITDPRLRDSCVASFGPAPVAAAPPAPRPAPYADDGSTPVPYVPRRGDGR